MHAAGQESGNSTSTAQEHDIMPAAIWAPAAGPSAAYLASCTPVLPYSDAGSTRQCCMVGRSNAVPWACMTSNRRRKSLPSTTSRPSLEPDIRTGSRCCSCSSTISRSTDLCRLVLRRGDAQEEEEREADR